MTRAVAECAAVSATPSPLVVDKSTDVVAEIVLEINKFVRRVRMDDSYIAEGVTDIRRVEDTRTAAQECTTLRSVRPQEPSERDLSFAPDNYIDPGSNPRELVCDGGQMNATGKDDSIRPTQLYAPRDLKGNV